MRAVLVIFPFLLLQNAFAAPVPKPSKEKPPEPPRFTRLLEHMSDSAIEALVGLADVVTSQPDLGNCEHFVYRVKMDLPQGLQMDAALNEFMSMVSPAERKFAWGLLGPSSPNTGILKMARNDVSEATQGKLNELNEKVSHLLNSHSHTVMLGGPALYSKAGIPDNEMVIRAIVDVDANEFLMFGAGLCK